MVPPQKMKRPPSQGRRKMELKKIDDAGKLQLSLLKRQEELSNKVRDCGGLCGAEIAVFGLSPDGNVFFCGHPSADAVIDRYLTEQCPSEPTHEHKQRLSAASKQMEAEKKQGAMNEQLEMVIKEGWWSEPIDGMELEEIEERKEAMQKLLENVQRRANELTMMSASSSRSPPFHVNPAPMNPARPVNRFNNQTTYPTTSKIPRRFGLGPEK